MSNTIEFREVHQRKTTPDGTFSENTWWEYRTKDTILSILGVSLSSWSDWQKVDVLKVDQNGNPL